MARQQKQGFSLQINRANLVIDLINTLYCHKIAQALCVRFFSLWQPNFCCLFGLNNYCFAEEGKNGHQLLWGRSFGFMHSFLLKKGEEVCVVNQPCVLCLSQETEEIVYYFRALEELTMMHCFLCSWHRQNLTSKTCSNLANKKLHSMQYEYVCDSNTSSHHLDFLFCKVSHTIIRISNPRGGRHL